MLTPDYSYNQNTKEDLKERLMYFEGQKAGLVLALNALETNQGKEGVDAHYRTTMQTINVIKSRL